MDHSPYPKIPESLQALQLDENAHRRLSRAEWVVTEKIHGANFCICTDGREVSFAKRKELLAPDEDFFGFSLLREELEEGAMAAWAHLAKEKPAGLRIYGELCGGGYPHPGVPPDARVQPVQTGVWYHPSVQFVCFDIGVPGEDGQMTYLDFDAMTRACAVAGLFCLPALFRGSWTEAIGYPLGFGSGLPGHFGLPEIADNLAEGVVIKPARDLWLQGPGGPVRPVIKRKLPRFAEDERFHGASAWTTGESTTDHIRVDAGFMAREVAPLMTRSRLQSAISKVGRLTPRTRGRIARELAEDVAGDLQNRFPGLPAEDWQRLNDWIAARAREMTR